MSFNHVIDHDRSEVEIRMNYWFNSDFVYSNELLTHYWYFSEAFAASLFPYLLVSSLPSTIVLKITQLLLIGSVLINATFIDNESKLIHMLMTALNIDESIFRFKLNQNINVELIMDKSKPQTDIEPYYVMHISAKLITILACFTITRA